METYTPTILKKWTRPDSYAGQSWPEYYSAAGRSRDSDTLEESNFQSILRRLGGESETVLVVRESHWAVGWVEWVAIHETDSAALRTADECRESIEDYPILDESDYSEREWNECAEFWEKSLTRAGRVDHFRTSSWSGGDWPTIRAAIGGDWYAAASLLHCPSDLIS